MPGVAQAARAVQGVVPSVVPLFPTPEGVQPNVKGNVQFEGQSVFSDPVPSGTAAEALGGDAHSSSTLPESAPTARAAAGPTRMWAWLLLGAVLVGGGVGLVLWRRRKERARI